MITAAGLPGVTCVHLQVQAFVFKLRCIFLDTLAQLLLMLPSEGRQSGAQLICLGASSCRCLLLASAFFLRPGG